MTQFDIRLSNGFQRIDLVDIPNLEAARNYCKAWLKDKFVLAPVSLKSAGEGLPKK